MLGTFLNQSKDAYLRVFIGHLYFLHWELGKECQIYFSLVDFIFFLILWNNIFSTKDIKATLEL